MKRIWLSFLALLLIAVPGSPQSEQAPPAAPKPLPAPTFYVVLLRVGPNYVKGHPPMEQTGFREHATYVNKLAEQGTMVIGGPFVTESGSMETTGAMVVLAVGSAEEARRVESADPLVAAGVTEIAEIRRFFVGAASWKSPGECTERVVAPGSTAPAAAGKKN